jgi:FtsH-binding integral membrane protein
MKKPLLLLITLILFTNVSYASFPVTESEKVEIREIDEKIEEEESKNGKYVMLSVIAAVVGIFFALLTLGAGLSHGGNPFPFFLLTIAALLVSVISGFKAIKDGSKKWHSYLGIGIAILGLVFIFGFLI